MKLFFEKGNANGKGERMSCWWEKCFQSRDPLARNTQRDNNPPPPLFSPIHKQMLGSRWRTSSEDRVWAGRVWKDWVLRKPRLGRPSLGKAEQAKSGKAEYGKSLQKQMYVRKIGSYLIWPRLCHSHFLNFS